MGRAAKKGVPQHACLLQHLCGGVGFQKISVSFRMRFPEDTIFLTLSRNARDQTTYEADVVRINLLDDTGYVSWRPEDDG